MFDRLMENFNTEGVVHVGTESGAPELEALGIAITAAHEATKPVLLLGTTLSHLHVIEAGEHVDLPEGSLVLETGGTKNLPEYDSDENRLTHYLKTYGVAAEQVLVEYGMAELGSQAYGRYGQRNRKSDIRPKLTFPSWTVCAVRDPDSNTEVDVGEDGVLQIFDPVNLDTCAFVLTSDLVRNEGENSFTMLGRVRDANPRGCSLDVPSPGNENHPGRSRKPSKPWIPRSMDLDKAPPGTRIKPLAAAWHNLSDMGGGENRESCQQLADSMGLSLPHILEGLRRESLRWSGDHLAEILARETSPFAAARIRVRPADGAVIIPASTVPFVGLESLTIALLAGCNVALKPSRRTEPEVSMFLRALGAHDPELAARVYLLDPEDDGALTHALGQAEAVVVHGDEGVIARVRAETQPNARIHAYGPRWSMAFLDPADAKVPELMSALATDIILYDSLGCLTPRLLYVMGEQREARWVADILGTAMDAAARRFEPHPDVSRRSVGAGMLPLAIENLRNDPRGVECVRQCGTAHLLVAGAPSRTSPGLHQPILPIRRGITVAALDLDQRAPIEEWLIADQPPLSSVGISSKILRSPLGKTIEEFALRNGAARITTPDRLQTPPAGWPHDGGPLFTPFARLVTPG